MRIAFWNTHNNKNINSLLVQLIYEKQIDIMLMAEYVADIAEVKDNLNSTGRCYDTYFTECKRIHILGNIEDVEPGFMCEYYGIHIINREIILCSVHLPSKIVSGSESARRSIIDDIKIHIAEHKKNSDVDKVILIGDFNENPYEKNILSINGLAGRPVLESVKKGTKIYYGKQVNLYYNPMWNFFGDFSCPMGTFYQKDDPETPYWNIYDQVLVSPSLAKYLDKNELQIVTQIGKCCLNNKNGKPNKRLYSDHLPIVVELRGM